MSQQNVNTTASESKESSLFNGPGDHGGAGELLGDSFFAPVESDLIDSLLGRYQHTRAKIEAIASMVTSGENATAVAHFISGNLSSRRGYYGRTVGEMFSVPGAVASLNSAFWQEALDLTDVYQYMPNDRRNEWNEQIREMAAPDFEEKTVRATLSELLFSREKFFAERIDGIFRSLSGEHVTNRPEGFGKRMIMARVYDEWGGNNYERTGYIDDLRQVVRCDEQQQVAAAERQRPDGSAEKSAEPAKSAPRRTTGTAGRATGGTAGCRLYAAAYGIHLCTCAGADRSDR